MKILNLYSGIGGNRKLWGNSHDITAVEYDEKIAAIYRDFFPDDTIVVGDAHQYLLEHYKEFDFIWASPPCPTHSRSRYWSSKGGMYDVVYPDMVLYQEIIFLQHFFSGKYCVENVKPYYDPLIQAQAMGRHLFWTNFIIPKMKVESNYIFSGDDSQRVEKMLGFGLNQYSGIDKIKTLRNCVAPDIGKAILDKANGIVVQESMSQGMLNFAEEEKKENK